MAFIIEQKYDWKGSFTLRSRTDMIILHHFAAKVASPTTVHGWHKNNGWIGIGYHYIVRKDGRIYRGRPEHVVGSHALNYNSRSIGIAFEGDFMVEQMPLAQKQAGMSLIADIRRRRGNLVIKGHRDVNATSCPGKNFPMSDMVNYTFIPAAPTPQIDMTPDDVSEVQAYLNEVLKLNLSVDGKPGPLTRAGVVKLFQKVLGLAIDGKFGPASLNKARANNLKKGSKGELVKVLQMALICKGYNLGTSGADGSFGPATQAAVLLFQKAHRLQQDGIVGGNTWNMLFT